MDEKLIRRTCKECREPGFGNFCSNCGQSFKTGKISIGSITNEVGEYFSFADRGFLLTLKKLLIAPGKLQRDYLMGHRVRYKNPFGMFLICACIAGGLILLGYPYIKLNDGSDRALKQPAFIYSLLVQLALVPVNSAVVWMLFRNNKINLAESLVLTVFSHSFVLLLFPLAALFQFFFPEVHPAIYELPLLFGYLCWTALNIFIQENRALVIFKTAVCSGVVYMIFKLASAALMHIIM